MKKLIKNMHNKHKNTKVDLHHKMHKNLTKMTGKINFIQSIHYMKP
jgi:hypothetical protein